ncbi:hypothetical protein [Streptomyces sp. HUAS TT7]|uniref:hypothetical protein n=1 Tax=Streptomyces sp. HUAS TT7 TaxID=3447507 RepID=UPI003F65923F
MSAPNVTLHPTRAEHIEGSIIVGADGRQIDADVIVLATGFHIGETPLSRRVYGSQGRTLHERWQEGRRAYLGTSVSGYPNLFLLLGPNILNGNVAVPTVLEAQLRYITDALTHLDRSKHTAMEVRPEVEEATGDPNRQRNPETVIMLMIPLAISEEPLRNEAELALA